MVEQHSFNAANSASNGFVKSARILAHQQQYLMNNSTRLLNLLCTSRRLSKLHVLLKKKVIFPMSHQCFPSLHLGMTGMFHVNHRHYQAQCFTLLFIVQLVSAFHDSVMFMLSYLISVSLDITIKYRGIVVFCMLYFTSSLSVRRAAQFNNVQAVQPTLVNCLQPPCAFLTGSVMFQGAPHSSPAPCAASPFTVHSRQFNL